MDSASNSLLQTMDPLMAFIVSVTMILHGMVILLVLGDPLMWNSKMELSMETMPSMVSA